MSFFSHDLCQHVRARNLADQLRLRSGKDRVELLTCMLFENGGTLIEPRPLDNSSAQRFELDLMGIHAASDTLCGTLDEWIAAARRCSPAPDTLPDDPIDTQVPA